MAVGFDFGTTNSACAVAKQGDVGLTTYSLLGNTTTSFRSLLYVPEDDGSRRMSIAAGPKAIEQYLDEGGAGRLMQSLKSFLPMVSFRSTRIGGQEYTLEELIAIILAEIRKATELQFGEVTQETVVVGRPVKLVNASDSEGEAVALGRLRKAFALAGFPHIEFEYEPVAAAYAYERRLSQDELLLVGDFGGGTSDFCILQVGPNAKKSKRILATGGAPVAGDNFDSRIVLKAITPLLGFGSFYRSMGDKRIEVPHWIYSRLSRWDQLSFLKDKENLRLLNGILPAAEEREAIERLIYLVEENLGFYLYRSVEKSKSTLSSEASAPLSFSEGPIEIDQLLERDIFEGWIEEEVGSIRDAMQGTLSAAGVKASQIGRVFLTGGTAFVPAVREMFVKEFGDGRLSGGEELTSVAAGLALRALEMERQN